MYENIGFDNRHQYIDLHNSCEYPERVTAVKKKHLKQSESQIFRKHCLKNIITILIMKFLWIT